MAELERYQANLKRLREQAAAFGMRPPLELINDIEYHEDKIKELEGSQLQKSNQLHWDNTGNVFWLGHDLRQAIDILATRGICDQLEQALLQAIHHARCIGLDRLDERPFIVDDQRFENATTMMSTTESAIERLMRLLTTTKIYKTQNKKGVLDSIIPIMQKDLWNVMMYIGKKAEAQQNNFRPIP